MSASEIYNLAHLFGGFCRLGIRFGSSRFCFGVTDLCINICLAVFIHSRITLQKGLGAEVWTAILPHPQALRTNNNYLWINLD